MSFKNKKVHGNVTQNPLRMKEFDNQDRDKMSINQYPRVAAGKIIFLQICYE